MFSDDYFMQQALLQAKRAAEDDEIPVGCILVIDNSIVTKAYNQTELLCDCTAHAEILALTSAFAALGTKVLPDATVYITLEPCLMCCGALYWARPAKIVYAASDPKNGYSKHFPNAHTEGVAVPPFHPKTIVRHGLLASECAELMTNFFRDKR